jgi:hypothetical protein
MKNMSIIDVDDFFLFRYYLGMNTLHLHCRGKSVMLSWVTFTFTLINVQTEIRSVVE